MLEHSPPQFGASVMVCCIPERGVNYPQHEQGVVDCPACPRRQMSTVPPELAVPGCASISTPLDSRCAPTRIRNVRMTTSVQQAIPISFREADMGIADPHGSGGDAMQICEGVIPPLGEWTVRGDVVVRPRACTNARELRSVVNVAPEPRTIVR